MARVTKPASIRQDELLDVAQRLFLGHGYADTPVQAIIDEVGIAKGTFYHHYPSKPALLDALVRRMVGQTTALVAPVVADPARGALDKLHALYALIGAWKAERKDLMVDLARALHREANLPLWVKIQADSQAALTPLLTAIIEQGVREKVFDTHHPQQTARIVLGVGRSLSDCLNSYFLADPPVEVDLPRLQAEVDAFHEALERVLGATQGSICLVPPGTLAFWFAEGPAPARRSS